MGEAALMYCRKGSFAGADGSGIFEILIGERLNRRRMGDTRGRHDNLEGSGQVRSIVIGDMNR